MTTKTKNMKIEWKKDQEDQENYIIEHEGGHSILDASVWERISDTEFTKRDDQSKLTLVPAAEVYPGCSQWVYTDPLGLRWEVWADGTTGYGRRH
jgi:hypothetical protein